MARWISTGALAFAWAALAAGQAPAPTPPPAVAAPALPRVGEVLTFRTSGQPERRVRIQGVVGTAETDGLADVQDLGTGAKYSLPLKVVALMARSSFTEAPTPAAPAAAPPLRPGTASALPALAQTLPNGPPPGDGGPPRAAAARPRVATAAVPDRRSALPAPTSVRTLMRPEAAAAPPAVTAPRPPKGPPARTYPPVLTVESEETTPIFRSVPPSVAVEVSPVVQVAATQAATTAVRAPLGAIAPPDYVVVPVLEYAPPVPPQPPAPAPQTSAPVAKATPNQVDSSGPPPVVPLAEPKPAILTPPAPAPTAAVAAPVVVPVSRVVPPPAAESAPPAALPAQMLEEVQPFVNELFQALRPSLRERAATGLTEGRYGSRPEVKATLARAALTDPAPTVRAHCIAQLARLGYHESSYLAYLDACAESGHAAVKNAAIAAIAKLASRN